MTMSHLSLLTPPTSVLHRCSRTLSGVEPGAFLSAFTGAPRGFWGRGDRWVAWGGALVDLHVASHDPNAVGTAVRDVRGTLDALHPLPIRGAAAPRLFGGFAFASGGERGSASVDTAWQGFPMARFILPEVLLEGKGSVTRLTLQWTEEPSPSAEARLADLVDRLAKAGGEGGASFSNGFGPGGESRAKASRPSVASDESASPKGRQDGGEKGLWSAAVDQILARIRQGDLEKAVLARILDVELSQPVAAPGILDRLRQENRRAHVFLFEPDPGRILLGAAPEILVELRGGCFHATAVAGSISRGGDVDADAELAARLRSSVKDMEEHRHTVEVMREVLTPLMSRLEVDPEPGVLTLARIQHLETGFHGRAHAGVDVLSLLEALHPTPAVCGRPRDRALELIRSYEPFHRGWYAGPVGWVDTEGDGDFVPALRSAVGYGTRWRLFAGAGIVEGSDPMMEWEETRLKFEPALRALGVGET